MNERQQKLQEETRAFVKSVDKQLILDMDAERVTYPADYMRALADVCYSKTNYSISKANCAQRVKSNT